MAGKGTGLKKALSIKEMQQAEYEMLQQFDLFCKQNKLDYWMVGGTLLGAVRHKGFIPWDDDIDIGMPRPHFERLLALAKEKPVGKYMELWSYQDDRTSQPFAQLVRKDMRLKKSADNYSKDYPVPYLWVDVFPIDGFPKRRWQKKWHLDKMALARTLSIRARARFGRGTSPVRMVAKMPFILVGRLIGVRRLRSFIVRTALRYPYEESEEVGIAVNGFYGPGEAYRKAAVYPLVDLPFEDSVFPAPKCYDSYLRGIYGDYQILPPPEKRKVHHMKVYRVRVKEDAGS